MKKILLVLLIIMLSTGSVFCGETEKAQCFKPKIDQFERSTGLVFVEKTDAIVSSVIYKEDGEAALAKHILKLKKIDAALLIPRGELVKILERENGLIKITPCEKNYEDVIVWGFESAFVPESLE